MKDCFKKNFIFFFVNVKITHLIKEDKCLKSKLELDIQKDLDKDAVDKLMLIVELELGELKS